MPQTNLVRLVYRIWLYLNIYLYICIIYIYSIEIFTSWGQTGASEYQKTVDFLGANPLGLHGPVDPLRGLWAGTVCLYIAKGAIYTFGFLFWN